jgi:hypothetical protein
MPIYSIQAPNGKTYSIEGPAGASQDEVIDLLGRGQGVFGIAVGRVLREVQASLVNIATLHLDDMDELAARRANKKAV